MQYTLLQMVQDILSSMDSDEVTTITGSTEAQQVVTIIKTVYDDIISRAELPIQKTVFNLTEATTAKPVLMSKPSTINSIDWIMYDKQVTGATDPDFHHVSWLCLDDFLRMTYAQRPSDTFVDSFSHIVNGSTVSFFYFNDRPPMHYTSFNDNSILFDAYDSAVDTHLMSLKTICSGELVTTFTNSDSFIPNLQPGQFALLYNEAKSLAWAELKQAPHAKAETTARRNWIHLQKTKQTIPTKQYDTGPNYGRR